MENKLNFALLIDADNASNKNINSIFMSCLQFGNLFIRRIYGDFTSQNLATWKEICSQYNIQPIQQFRNTIGKNATDSALIIDAMDILYQKKEMLSGGFILVSSDSDFTKLASRIRENNLKVIGIGKQNTAESFINACNEFYFVENLQNDIIAEKILQDNNNTEKEIISKYFEQIKNELKCELEIELKNKSNQKNKIKNTSPNQLFLNYNSNNDTSKIIYNYIIEFNNNDKKKKYGWSLITHFATYIKTKISDFSLKNFGSSNFVKLIKKYGNNQVIIEKDKYKVLKGK